MPEFSALLIGGNEFYSRHKWMKAHSVRKKLQFLRVITILRVVSPSVRI